MNVVFKQFLHSFVMSLLVTFLCVEGVRKILYTIFVIFWVSLGKNRTKYFLSVNFGCILFPFLGHVASKEGVMVGPRNI